MTYENWWWEFIAEHEDWRYADSDALRKHAFAAGAASRDAEIAELVTALEKLACLGNGDKYGNSIGNCIAQDALAKVRKP